LLVGGEKSVVTSGKTGRVQIHAIHAIYDVPNGESNVYYYLNTAYKKAFGLPVTFNGAYIKKLNFGDKCRYNI
jgi:hypothetical protein